MTDDFERQVLQSFRAFMDRAVASVDPNLQSKLSPLGEVVSAHLGVTASTLPVVSEVLLAHRLVDADAALTVIAHADESTLLGVSGGQQRFHSTFPELIASPFVPFGPGPVDFVSQSTGPSATIQVVSFGLRLLQFDGRPIAVLQRAANPQFGRSEAELEVMAEDPALVTAFIEHVRRLMIEHSVLRGKVLSFEVSQFGAGAGVTFVPRPSVGVDDIVLPEGVLAKVVDHVVGIGEQRDVLLAAGQHLKRGVLLYGPPGTGKTLTVRHLVSRTPGTTVVLLTGSSIAFITQAAEIARTFQPSIVVMEDIDLVAMERHTSPQPLLFEVLDALDGLDGDADVAFIMTTNRVEVLERALAERPGRVDLAVEIPLPALAERERLFAHYAGSLPLSAETLVEAAQRAEGVTGSFAKELIRRAVLRAALENRPVADGDLQAALDELLSARETLTRSLLGSNPLQGDPDEGLDHESPYVSFDGAYVPLDHDPGFRG